MEKGKKWFTGSTRPYIIKWLLRGRGGGGDAKVEGGDHIGGGVAGNTLADGPLLLHTQSIRMYGRPYTHTQCQLTNGYQQKLISSS